MSDFQMLKIEIGDRRGFGTDIACTDFAMADFAHMGLDWQNELQNQWMLAKISTAKSEGGKISKSQISDTYQYLILQPLTDFTTDTRQLVYSVQGFTKLSMFNQGYS